MYDARPDAGRLDKVKQDIEVWRRSLLDLTRRNRLLYFGAGLSTRIQIIKPSSQDLYQVLTTEGRILEFPYARGMTVDDVDLSEFPSAGIRIVQGDLGVHPPVSQLHELRQLHRRLERLRRGTRTIFEEQGVNTLFVSLGILEWREAEYAEETVRSPLVLLPVTLERREDRYVLAPHDDDVEVNPVLTYRLQRDFGINLPTLDTGVEGFPEVERAIDEFLRRTQELVGRHGWRVAEEAWLAQFAFYKLVMYRDLEGSEVAERAARHPIVASLCGFYEDRKAQGIDVRQVEEKYVKPETFPVLDADSSQLEVLERVRRGETLVVQGPPGTGKSQTIVNIISQALRDGKTVLFVSEKRAALEVVYDRLKHYGLDDPCLELHSHTASRKAVVQELVETLEAVRNRRRELDTRAFDEYRKLKAQLDAYVEELHRPRDRQRRSVYQVQGRLAKLGRYLPLVSADLPLKPILDIDPANESEAANLIREIATIGVWPLEGQHPWKHATPRSKFPIIPDLVARVCEEGESACEVLIRVTQVIHELFGLEAHTAELLKEAQRILQHLAKRPSGVIREEWLETESRAARSVVEAVFEIAKWMVNRRYRWARSLTALCGGHASERLRQFVVSVPEDQLRLSTGDLLADIQGALRSFENVVQEETLRKLFPDGVNGHKFSQISFNELKERFQAWRQEVGRLQQWVTYFALMNRAREIGLDSFLAECRRRRVPADLLEKVLWRTYLTYWLKEAYEQAPVLAAFDPKKWEALRARFQDLDKALQGEAVKETLYIVASRVDPLPLNEERRLKREAAKKRRHIPLRRLFPQIPKLLLSLKPCLMMSPLAVATYLPKELFRFDLVIFDEASQLPPGDAIGVLLRAEQAVIFGDSKQLPPTDFFQAHVEGEEEEGEASDYESILDIAGACFPGSMLCWHYRSRDERLIAFSNQRFYGGRLITFPAPVLDSQETGIQFIHVSEGVYGRGGSRTNPEEARRVAELVLEHFRLRHNRSLGVIAMSIEQRDAIEEALRRAVRDCPGVSIRRDGPEPFFVKNLEAVQGDERDEIILSIGYGPSEPGGRPLLQFGPLNREGGERRLNVAVTRARYKFTVVSSIRPDQLIGIQTRWEGPRLLGEYLDYAACGGVHVAVSSAGQPESEFEEVVRDALATRGYAVDCQVGASGYRIDLAVRHPDAPGRYLVGIECDGATYHSAQTARDRDRIRQEALEARGWRIIRVWSTDWIRDPDGAAARLVEDIEKLRWFSDDPTFREARSESPRNPNNESLRPEGPVNPSQSAPTLLKDPSSLQPRHAVPPDPQTALIRFPPYQHYRVDRTPRPPLLGEQSTTLAQLIRDVVNIEGPVHVSRVLNTVAEIYGQRRLGKRLRKVISRGLHLCIQKGWVIKKGEFLWSPNCDRPVPRDHGSIRRPPEHIAPEEWEAAVVEALRQLGATQAEGLIRTVSKAMGFERLSGSTRSRIEHAISSLQGQDAIVELDGFLYFSSR